MGFHCQYLLHGNKFINWTQGTNFDEILIRIHTFSFKKIHFKMSSGKWQAFCLSLNVLNSQVPFAFIWEKILKMALYQIKISVILITDYEITMCNLTENFPHFLYVRGDNDRYCSKYCHYRLCQVNQTPILMVSTFTPQCQVGIVIHKLYSVQLWIIILFGISCRADSRLAPSQWQTSLQSNSVSHWLGATLEWALNYQWRWTHIWKNTANETISINDKADLYQNINALRHTIFDLEMMGINLKEH